MATWFSDPVEWQALMTLRTQSDNSMNVFVNNGPIVLKALFDGFVVFRKTSADGAPVVGNLELVLTPGNWSDEMQKFFNPTPNDKGVKSKFSELPPGRVVYRSLARGDIQTKLHELIFTKFNAWRLDRSKNHKVLSYIIDPTSSTTLLKDVLLAEWNKGLSESDSKRLVDLKIDETLDKVFDTGFLNPLGNSLPVEGADILASIGTASLPVELVFEIRNLYGEPINPHFYLRKLEQATNQLTPRPPFKLDDNQSPRLKAASDQPLPIRLPQHSGSVFSLLEGAGGRTPYQSQLIWNYKLDPADADYPAKVEARPGQSPTVPQPDPNMQPSVNAMWDNDHLAINKYAEFFSCPCELMLATIRKESAQWVDALGDTHSIRFEPIPEKADYAKDHEALRTAGSPLTRSCLDAYWKIAGGWHTDWSKSFYEAENKEIKTEDLPKLELTDLVLPATKIGTSDENRKLISWAQIQKIETVKASLIKRTDMILPALGATHYDLIKSGVSEEAARQYFAKVGGIGGAGDAAKPPTPFTLKDYPLPLTTKEDVMVVDSTMKWKNVLAVLKVLRTAGVSGVPKATYTLQPLAKDPDVDIHDKFTAGQLMKTLKVDKPTAMGVVARYIKLMNKRLDFHEDTTTPDNGKVKNHDQASGADFLTLKETKAMSRVYPHCISIGVGQILLETGVRKVIDFVKTHYPHTIFTELGASIPTDKIAEKITWLWTELWNKRNLQIAFIAAYHKQNATVHWQSINAENSKKMIYRVGERMTMFDFPKSGACYNAGSVRKPDDGDPDTAWGLETFGAYQGELYSAIVAAAKRFNNFSSPDPKWAKVRLRPDLETDSGMDAR